MITRFLTRLRYCRLVLRLARRVGARDSRGILATGEKILELEPEEPLTLSTMANAYAAQGEEERALALRLRALEQDPHSFYSSRRRPTPTSIAETRIGRTL